MRFIFPTILLLVGCQMFGCSHKDLDTSKVVVEEQDPANSREFGTPNDAPTLKPIVLAYYRAIQNKDEAALRKILSSHYLQTLESAIKQSGAKARLIDVAGYGNGTDVPLDQIEVRNEVFDRNEYVDNGKAAAQVRKGPNAGWEWVPFSRGVDGWKLTDEPFSLMRVVSVENQALQVSVK